jgi:hypothetical protein
MGPYGSPYSKMTRLTRVSTRIVNIGLSVCGYRYREAASERLPLTKSIYLIAVHGELVNALRLFAECLLVKRLVERNHASPFFDKFKIRTLYPFAMLKSLLSSTRGRFGSYFCATPKNWVPISRSSPAAEISIGPSYPCVDLIAIGVYVSSYTLLIMNNFTMQ